MLLPGRRLKLLPRPPLTEQVRRRACLQVSGVKKFRFGTRASLSGRIASSSLRRGKITAVALALK